jgi:hypothetical protein
VTPACVAEPRTAWVAMNAPLRLASSAVIFSAPGTRGGGGLWFQSFSPVRHQHSVAGRRHHAPLTMPSALGWPGGDGAHRSPL